MFDVSTIQEVPVAGDELGERLRGLLSKATLPWMISQTNGGSSAICEDTGRPEFPIATAPDFIKPGVINDRLALIVAAVNALPELLTRLTAQADEIARLTSERDEARTGWGASMEIAAQYGHRLTVAEQHSARQAEQVRVLAEALEPFTDPSGLSNSLDPGTATAFWPATVADVRRAREVRDTALPSIGAGHAL